MPKKILQSRVYEGDLPFPFSLNSEEESKEFKPLVLPFYKYIENLDEFLNSLDTGDILLFSGNTLFSKAIKLVTRSHWSHIGMVLKDDDGLLYCFESDNEPIKDIPEIGVRKVPLKYKIETYDGEIAIRMLEVPELKQTILREEIKQLCNQFKNIPYEKHFLELIKSAYDGPFGENKEDLTSIFCSELIASIYQKCGLLNWDIPSNEYTPANFSITNLTPENFSTKTLNLIRNILTDIEYIKSKIL